MRRKFSQDALVLIILFLFLAVSMYFMSSREEGGSGMDVAIRRTSYSTKAFGLKALHQTLDKTGYRVKRHLNPLTIPPDDGVLFIISPSRGIAPYEWKHLQNWVERGNTLIVNNEDNFEEENGKSLSVKAFPVCPSFLSPDIKHVNIPAKSAVTEHSWSFSQDDIVPAAGGG